MTGKGLGVAVIEIFMVAEEVVNHKTFLANMRCRSGAPAAHLLVKDRASNSPAHNKVQELPAIKAGIQHANAYSNLRIVFLFEFSD